MPFMLYEDSLSRMFGAPGSGKSFVALDIALSMAAGRFWGGRRLEQRKVVYVMAEGQRVNADRAEAWTSRHGVGVEDLDDWFFAVPDAIALTEHGVTELVAWVRDNQPGLVVLDTKNAMMIGEENSASDFAAMRRALDLIRKAAGCCVLLVDHTGYEGTRARGTSAGTAAMDTEIKVTKDDDQKPSLITAEVTRDKAAEAGHTLAWHLTPEHPAAVLVSTTAAVQTKEDMRPDWVRDETPLPDAIEGYEGPGQRAVVPLARYMRMVAGPKGDMARIGRTLADARTELKDEVDRKTVGIAWSSLKAMGYLECRFEEPTETQERTGAHVWNDPNRSA